MNERIHELIDQSGLVAVQEMFQEELYKFAELIVRECAQYLYEHYPHSRYEVNYMRKHMGDLDWNKPIEKHFGVEV